MYTLEVGVGFLIAIVLVCCILQCGSICSKCSKSGKNEKDDSVDLSAGYDAVNQMEENQQHHEKEESITVEVEGIKSNKKLRKDNNSAQLTLLESLDTLRNLGFTDETQNIAALELCNGDMNRVIQNLLETDTEKSIIRLPFTHQQHSIPPPEHSHHSGGAHSPAPSTGSVGDAVLQSPSSRNTALSVPQHLVSPRVKLMPNASGSRSEHHSQSGQPRRGTSPRRKLSLQKFSPKNFSLRGRHSHSRQSTNERLEQMEAEISAMQQSLGAQSVIGTQPTPPILHDADQPISSHQIGQTLQIRIDEHPQHEVNEEEYFVGQKILISPIGHKHMKIAAQIKERNGMWITIKYDNFVYHNDADTEVLHIVNDAARIFLADDMMNDSEMEALHNTMSRRATSFETNRTYATMTSNNGVDRECVVCMAEYRSYACIPCGHLCLCAKCKDELYDKTCPICQQPYQAFIKIYQS